MVVLRALVLATGLAACGSAVAHVSVQPTTAAPGAYQVLRFGVGHGCGDTAATTALRLEIPAGVTVARPQPKPGWEVQIVRTGDQVTALVWRGRLAPDQFDEFVVLTKLPATAGPLPFPALQTCEGAENRWTEIAQPGVPRPKWPVPTLNLVPAAPDAGHDHH